MVYGVVSSAGRVHGARLAARPWSSHRGRFGRQIQREVRRTAGCLPSGGRANGMQRGISVCLPMMYCFSQPCGCVCGNPQGSFTSFTKEIRKSAGAMLVSQARSLASRLQPATVDPAHTTVDPAHAPRFRPQWLLVLPTPRAAGVTPTTAVPSGTVPRRCVVGRLWLWLCGCGCVAVGLCSCE